MQIAVGIGYSRSNIGRTGCASTGISSPEQINQNIKTHSITSCRYLLAMPCAIPYTYYGVKSRGACAGGWFDGEKMARSAEKVTVALRLLPRLTTFIPTKISSRFCDGLPILDHPLGPIYPFFAYSIHH